MTLDNVRARILAHRFSASSEAVLQDGIARVLTEAEVPFEKEARLGPKDRVDFLLGKLGEHIAVEVKIEGAFNAVLAQLHRYAQHEAVREVWLITVRAQHRPMPPDLAGKPVRVLYLASSVL